ncbi:MAG: DUF4349 domain-containing protein [Acidimicrobiia bacterium]
MRKLRWVAALLASMMILGACGGDSGEAESLDAGATEATVAASGGDPSAPEQFGVTDEALTNQTVVDRKVIRTGQMEIEVTDTRAAMEEITRLVNRSGGYVSSSEVAPSGAEEQPYVTLIIRVPAGDLDTALSAIRELSEKVAYESIQSQDVTEEYVDIEARLRNLTALETELVALLAEVRTQPDADPQKLLTVFNEVSRVRGEIEVLEGRRRLIDNQASLSTITVTISPSPSSTPIVEEGWAPLVTVRNATGDLVEALQTMANAGIWLVVFALPVLALIALPIWVGLRILKRVSRRRHTPIEAPSAELETVDQG